MRLVMALICLLVSNFVIAAPVMVDAQWLKQRLDDKNIVVVDMTSDDLQYTRFHIPGAVRLSYSDIVTRRKKDKVAVRLPDGNIEKLLGALGIGASTHVVIYDDIGSMEAGRLYWELERLGHKKMSVLDGGIVQWVLDGHKVTNLVARPSAVAYKTNGGGRANEADLAYVREASDKGTAVLLDVRSQDEYIGHPRYPRSGHIPGARWLGWDTNVDFQNGFKLKKEADLMANLKISGITGKQDPVVVYCRSGHRASQTYLTLRKLGFEDVRLYDGSMAEYEQDKTAPVVKGLSPK